MERLDRDAAGIDLLLTDVVMPDGVNGVDLAVRIRERHPALPIILMSGYNDVAASEGAVFPMLRKPVPYEDLYRAISSRLEHLRRVIA
jgi:DNA-binding NtrC family response regulator